MAHAPGIDEALYRDYLVSLLQGNLYRCRNLVRELLRQGQSLCAVYEDLLARALRQIGEMWAKSEISVAVEHLASAQTEDVMRMIFSLVARAPRLDRKAIISCIVNEQHCIGSRMVADLMEVDGWDVAYLGANTPKDSLLGLVEQLQPDLLGLSVTMPENLSGLYEAVAEARHRFPRLAIIVGGQAFHLAGLGSQPAIPGARYFETAAQVQQAFSGRMGPFD